ncbi:MAG TPA: fibronectin type III domain-containing protein [Patescibacteria group bacterium]|nr:fibronectin type III domain-containing protein [Patescibacteria group bacterium]
MRKLSLILVAALLTILAVHAANKNIVKADVELDITCGCSTPTPTPTFVPTPTPTTQPTSTPNNSTPPNGNVGAPVCTDPVPAKPIITSVKQIGTKATITWTKIDMANHYVIFYGTDPGSEEFGVPDTGNVTSYTINSLNPKLKYYFDVLSVNGCQPSSNGQVLGASTSVLASTDSDLIMPRFILGIIAAGVTFFVIKKYSL